MIKQKRNDKCNCNSGKKYKQCCFIKTSLVKAHEDIKYLEGHNDSSSEITQCATYLREQYSDHKIIDISDYLNNETYRTFQIKNYKLKTIMLAQKNEHNKDVFSTRNETNDIIIMYRGSYRTCTLRDFDKYIDNINSMIQTRLEGKEE